MTPELYTIVRGDTDELVDESEKRPAEFQVLLEEERGSGFTLTAADMPGVVDLPAEAQGAPGGPPSYHFLPPLAHPPPSNAVLYVPRLTGGSLANSPAPLSGRAPQHGGERAVAGLGPGVAECRLPTLLALTGVALTLHDGAVDAVLAGTYHASLRRAAGAYPDDGMAIPEHPLDLSLLRCAMGASVSDDDFSDLCLAGSLGSL